MQGGKWSQCKSEKKNITVSITAFLTFKVFRIVSLSISYLVIAEECKIDHKHLNVEYCQLMIMLNLSSTRFANYSYLVRVVIVQLHVGDEVFELGAVLVT